MLLLGGVVKAKRALCRLSRERIIAEAHSGMRGSRVAKMEL